MKKSLLIFIICSITICAMGQKTMQVVQSDMHHMAIEFNSTELHVSTSVYDDRPFSLLDMNGFGASAIVGLPKLPVSFALVEIPICEDINYVIKSIVYDTIDLGLRNWVMPAQPSQCKSDYTHHELQIDKKVYEKDDYFSYDLVQVKKLGIARDKNLAKVSFAPIQYNPQTGKIIVCKYAIVEFEYQNVDEKATVELDKYSTPSFSIGHEVLNSLQTGVKLSNSSSPIRMVIVANSMFKDSLADYVAWKRRKGFIVDEAYTDQPEVGTSSNSIKNYLKGLYTNATESIPAPTYILLVGDIDKVPTCPDNYPADAFWYEEHHPTDLYYAEWTGDMLPDAYYGRFSAQNLEQLMPQIEKTLMYEQYLFEDPSFLDNAVMVAGVDYNFGRSHADPTVSQATKFYINGDNGYAQVKCFQNNIATNPAATNVSVFTNTNPSTVKAAYNEGAGWINYTAHGDKTCWADPSFVNSEVWQMTNNQKFGVMIGNCCLTNKFDEPECFGEALVRKGDYAGALCYIGGSNYTYWDEDVYWSMGVRANIYSSMPLEYNAAHLGMYDKLFHLNSESHDDWITCVGGIVVAGNMSVESSSSSLNNYYWEVYHVMGDPSIVPWLTQPDVMDIHVDNIYTGATSATVKAVPYAYVALTLDSVLIAATYADETGNAILHFNSIDKGVYELAVSAMGYQTLFVTMDVHGVGIENTDNLRYSIYPNPVTSYINVDMEGLQEVSIVNVKGEVILREQVDSNSIQMDLQNLPNGVYFVCVKSLNDYVVEKIIKR